VASQGAGSSSGALEAGSGVGPGAGGVLEPCVVHAAFSGDGGALATVELRPDAGAWVRVCVRTLEGGGCAQ